MEKNRGQQVNGGKKNSNTLVVIATTMGLWRVNRPVKIEQVMSQ
jgi:hypothetical protein